MIILNVSNGIDADQASYNPDDQTHDNCQIIHVKMGSPFRHFSGQIQRQHRNGTRPGQKCRIDLPIAKCIVGYDSHQYNLTGHNQTIRRVRMRKELIVLSSAQHKNRKVNHGRHDGQCRSLDDRLAQRINPFTAAHNKKEKGNNKREEDQKFNYSHDFSLRHASMHRPPI